MKKTILMIIIMLFPLLAHTQSDSLKVAYRQVCATLKDYKFESQDAVEGHGTTKSIVLKIQKGYFVFSINDDFGSRNDPFFGHRYGIKTLKVPCDDMSFDLWFDLYIKSVKGIELTYKGKKELIESYRIIGEKLTLKRLCKELQSLQNIIIKENFQGTLDGSSAPKNNTQSFPQNSNTPKQPQKKPRNRVPAGI